MSKMPEMVESDSGSREQERVTAFTDAAVAIALTLLVLPLVDVARESAGIPWPELWREHSGDVLAFVISFFVIALFWRAHRRIFESIDRVDEPLLTLNTLWLLGVVFLPVPTAVLTFEDDTASAPAVFYLGTLFYVSVMSTALNGWVATHPRLHRPGGQTAGFVSQGATAAATIGVAAVLAVPLGNLALVLLLALPLVGRLTPARSRTR